MSSPSPSRADLDSEQLSRFIDGLRTYPRVRIPLDHIWSLFAESFPSRPQGRDERVWLLRCLELAVDEGAVRWPAEQGSRWDRSMTPALPTAMDRVRATSPPGTEWRQEAWHPDLLWVLDLPRLSDAQHAFLRRVHQGLVEGWFRTPAPLRHRSLVLTGDEKELLRLRRTSLFGPGRLTLSMLGCVREPTPLAWERVGEGGDMLVFENSGPFHVAREVLTSLEVPPYGLVAYGGGASFRHALRYIRAIELPVTRLRYVGDLDWPGLRIAAAAAAVADEEGLPELEPATDLHKLMFEQAAAFGYPGGWPYTSASASDPDWADWLAPAVRRQVLATLQRGRRVPEEVIGPDILRSRWWPHTSAPGAPLSRP